jgi:FKBP-type peptidyl-prolyl cis-trans isomerase (trigger factor)
MIPSTLNIPLTITPQLYKSKYNTVYQKVLKNTHVKGFRKGTAPQSLAAKQVDEAKVLQLTVSELLPELLEEALKQESQKRKRTMLLTEPNYRIQNDFDPDKDNTFEAEVILYPEIDVSFIKTHKFVPQPAQEVTEQEVDELIANLRQNFQYIQNQDQSPPIHQAPTDSDKPHSTDSQSSQSSASQQINEEEFLQKLQVSSLSELRDILKLELAHKHQHQAQIQSEQKLLDEITTNTQADIPKILIDEEYQHLLSDLQQRLAKIGLDLDTYAGSIQSTSDQELQKLQDQALRNVTTMLALAEIRTLFDIQLDENTLSEIEKEKDTQKQNVLKFMALQRITLEYLFNNQQHQPSSEDSS